MRLPPNGKALFDLRRAGRIPVAGPFGHVAVLPEWDMEVTGAYVVAPPDIDPAELDFCFVADLDVGVFQRMGNVGSPLDLDLISAIRAGDPARIALFDLNSLAKGFNAALWNVWNCR